MTRSISALFTLLFAVLLTTNCQAQQICPHCGRLRAPSTASSANSVKLIHSEGTGRQLQVAIQSALYRATNRIRGHSRIDSNSGFANGVGWATHDPRPRTCFNTNPGAYAVAIGADGQYYSTRVLY